MTIEITDYQIFTFSHDKFNLVQGNDFIINNYGFNYAKFSIVPCNEMCRINYIGVNGRRQFEDEYPFQKSYRIQEFDKFLLNTLNSYSYINYYQDNDDQDYSFKDNLTSLDPFIPNLANMTHIRLIFYELFSNSPEINYMYVISKDENQENEKILEPFCNFFYNLL